MKPVNEYDDEYEQAVMRAVTEAILLTSLHETPDGRMALMRSAEIMRALLICGAGIVASSEALNTPSRVREFCDEQAKQLRRLIHSAQANPMLDTVFSSRIQPGAAQ